MADNNSSWQASRDGFGRGIVEAAAKDPRIVVLSADLAESLRLSEFQKEFPDRFIECGVAEQNMMGVAAGLALAGKIPFVCSFAVFNPGLNWTQLRVAAYSRLPIKVVGGHAGISTGEDGATHQALEDLALTLSLPNLTVVQPADSQQAKELTQIIAKQSQASYLRLSREKVPSLSSLLKKLPTAIKATHLVKEKAQLLSQGKDLTIVASGLLVQAALQAAVELSTINISCDVINLYTLKPLDTSTIINSVKKTRAVLLAAEHQVNGGLTTLVATALAQELGQQLSQSFALEILGMEDQFGESGSGRALLDKYQLNSTGILRKAAQLLEKKKNLFR